MRLWAGWVFLLMVTACKPDAQKEESTPTPSSTTGSPGGGSQSLDQICAQASQVVCDTLLRCEYVESRQECTQFQSSECLREEKAAIKDGRMTYDAACLQRQLQHVSTVACDAFFSVNELCDPFNGLVRDGGACYFDEECSTTSYCDENGGCPGICAPKKPVGAPAQSSLECQDGLTVYDGKCATLVPAEGSCAPVAPATYPRSCVAGHMCDGETKICKPYLARGQTCTMSYECAAGLVCTNRRCGDLSPLGGVCRESDPQIPCKYSLFCNEATPGATGTCAARLAVGGACFNSHDCAENLYCDGSVPFGPDAKKGTCKQRLTVGATCDPRTYNCETELYCDPSSKCSAKLGVGATCWTYDACKEGSCKGLTCDAAGCLPGTCAPYTPAASCEDPTP